MADTPTKKAKHSHVPQHAILGICNPLLDISAHVPLALLDKYDLKLGNAILAEDKHKPLYKELVETQKVSYLAGGSGQNTVRVAQWMLQQKGATTYLGCVGTDEYGRRLREETKKEGVLAHYQETPEHPTGTCAVLVHDRERSLVAHLGAANHFKESHIEQADTWKLVEAAKVVYATGFFLTVSVPSLLKLAEFCHNNDRLFTTNLSADFVCKFFKEQQMKLFPYVDYVFGNDGEAKAMAEAQGWAETDVGAIAQKISAMPKLNAKRPRVAVISQGKKPVLVSVGGGAVQAFPVQLVPEAEIVDVNGAGDAFVGGFLALLVQGASLKDCVRAGNYAAGQVIRHDGCSFPPKPDLESYPASEELKQ
jgi:adenosine kinase